MAATFEIRWFFQAKDEDGQMVEFDGWDNVDMDSLDDEDEALEFVKQRIERRYDCPDYTEQEIEVSVDDCYEIEN